MFWRAPRSTSTATPTTSAPASRSASTAVSGDAPVVDVSSTASTRRPATSPLTAVEALREAGADVVGVAVLVDRGARQNVTGRGLAFRAAYELADLGV